MMPPSEHSINSSAVSGTRESRKAGSVSASVNDKNVFSFYILTLRVY